MVTVLGVFDDRERALNTLESLRSAQVESDNVRLIVGSDAIAELATTTGPSSNLTGGPVGAVLGGLVGASLSEDELADVTRRVEGGAVVLLGEGLDSDAARRFEAELREHQAGDVISHE